MSIKYSAPILYWEGYTGACQAGAELLWEVVVISGKRWYATPAISSPRGRIAIAYPYEEEIHAANRLHVTRFKVEDLVRADRDCYSALMRPGGIMETLRAMGVKRTPMGGHKGWKAF